MMVAYGKCKCGPSPVTLTVSAAVGPRRSRTGSSVVPRYTCVSPVSTHSPAD